MIHDQMFLTWEIVEIPLARYQRIKAFFARLCGKVEQRPKKIELVRVMTWQLGLGLSATREEVFSKAIEEGLRPVPWDVEEGFSKSLRPVNGLFKQERPVWIFGSDTEFQGVFLRHFVRPGTWESISPEKTKGPWSSSQEWIFAR